MSEKQYIERYWRDARLGDAIKRPPMVARFRDNNDDQWIEDFLCGVDTENNFWFSKGDIPHVFWNFCQVYDAPNPGEGYELIDITKATKQKGDEFLSFDEGWKPAHSDEFFSSHFYRRRITPAVTYVPFTWEDREQLRGRWIYREEDSGIVLERPIHQFEFDLKNLFLINGYTTKQMLDSWRFIDTKEPVGKKVE